MSYPNYLIHFNKNHSSKDGKFTYGDGDGDGITDDHSNQRKYLTNRYAIKGGYQNKDGTLTAKGQKALDARKQDIKNETVYEKEYRKIRKNKGYEEMDDVDDKTLERYAKKDGIDTKAFHEAYTKRDKFYEQNEELISAGYRMTQEMMDLDPNFSKMTAKELYEKSSHHSDLGSTFVYGLLGMPLFTTLSFVGSVGSGIELARYDAERRRQQKNKE